MSAIETCRTAALGGHVPGRVSHRRRAAYNDPRSHGIYNRSGIGARAREADSKFYPMVDALRRLQLSGAVSIRLEKRAQHEQPVETGIGFHLRGINTEPFAPRISQEATVSGVAHQRLNALRQLTFEPSQHGSPGLGVLAGLFRVAASG
jgi:hypothetical protein